MVGLDAYRTRRDLAVSLLRDYGIHEYTPQGAFYLLVNCGTADSEAFAAELLRRRGVAVAPGVGFGKLSSAHVRVALCSSEADIAHGLKQLCEAATARPER